MGVILGIIIFLILLFFLLMALAITMLGGLFIGGMCGYVVSVINYLKSISYEVSNLFMKIVLYAVVGVLAILPFVTICIALLLAIFGLA